MMERFPSLEQAMWFVSGRLTGLAGTTRYSSTQLSDEVREELIEISQILITQLSKETNDIPNF